MACNHDDANPRHLFCHCGKLLDREGLKKVRFTQFLGTQSTNPRMEEFWATGDPDVF